MVYLDNAATTKISDGAVRAVSNTLEQYFANPGSLYDIGFEAQKALERARETVASALGCKTGELYFTSSGTESNNLAILGSARARSGWGSEAVVTGYEHPSAANSVKQLSREGFEVKTIMPGADGTVDPDELLAAVGKKTALVCVMRVNNETGAMLDTAYLAARVHEINKRTAFHCDNVQGFMKHPLALAGGPDTVSISAHKIHGPKGIGALYVREGFHLENTLFGGKQERGLRPGTENLAYAAGFVQAVREHGAEENDVRELCDMLRDGLSKLGGAIINSPLSASPYILNFSLIGYRSETLLHFLAQKGIYVSSGSACSRGERSHTLTAMGLSDARCDSAVRVSFSSNTPQDVKQLLDALAAAQKELVRNGN